MIPLVTPGPGCVLQILETRVEAGRDAGSGPTWLESTHVEVAASPDCRWVEIAVPSDARLDGWSGRSLLADGIRRKLGPERVTRRIRDTDGAGAIRVALPELVQGDRAALDIERTWSGGMAWSAGAALYASIEGPVEDAAGLQQDGDRWWVATPEGADPAVASARIGRPAGEPVSLPLADPPREPGRRLTIQIPPGNPQYSLYPGGGATTRVDAAWTFAAAPEPRGWVVPVPDGAVVDGVVEPRGSAEIVRRDDSILVRIAASEGTSRVALSWTEPDAPTFGEGDAGLTVDCEGCLIRWEGPLERRTWWLAAVADDPILPARDALVRGLDRRFQNATIPEPGLPNELRGRIADWDLPMDAWAILRQRWGVLPLDADPGFTGAPDALWPRRLIRARRSGALTGTEAALTLVAWLRQARMGAEWAFVRPVSHGPGWGTSPAGYVLPLVAVRRDGETRWIDVGCAECGPWEIRPDSAGAALAPAGIRPPPPRGVTTVTQRDHVATWRLEGAAALSLRERLAALPVALRVQAIAEACGAPSAIVREVAGLAIAGGPIDLVLEGAPAAAEAAPGAAAAWVGEWSSRSPAGDAGPANAAVPGATWERRIDGGDRIDVWIIEDRSADLTDLRARIAAAAGGIAPDL